MGFPQPRLVPPARFCSRAQVSPTFPPYNVYSLPAMPRNRHPKTTQEGSLPRAPGIPRVSPCARSYCLPIHSWVSELGFHAPPMLTTPSKGADLPPKQTSCNGHACL